MNTIDSHECSPPKGDCYKVLLTLELPKKESSMPQKKKEGKKERLRQQGNPCLRELRKTFTSGASTRQNSNIKLGRRSLGKVR